MSLVRLRCEDGSASSRVRVYARSGPAGRSFLCLRRCPRPDKPSATNRNARVRQTPVWCRPRRVQGACAAPTQAIIEMDPSTKLQAISVSFTQRAAHILLTAARNAPSKNRRFARRSAAVYCKHQEGHANICSKERGSCRAAEATAPLAAPRPGSLRRQRRLAPRATARAPVAPRSPHR